MAAALVAYVAMRATVVPITIDEALTARWHVPAPWTGIVLMRTEGLDDNNHVLFTLLAKLGVGAFGLSELSLRWPTIAGYGLFVAALLCLLARLARGFLQPLGLLAIGFNPYLVDYFTVARGYGLGLALMTAGLAALVEGLEDAPASVRPWHVRGAFACFTLAALAHLTFVLALIAAALVLWVPFVLAGRGTLLWTRLRPTTIAAWIAVIVTAIGQVYLLHPLMVLRRQGFFKLQESHGFWMDTVGSLVDGTLQDAAYAPAVRAAVFAWIAASMVIALACVVGSRAGARESLPLRVVLAMLLLVAVGSVMQRVLFGVSLLDGRRGLALLVLFLLVAAGLPRAAPSGGPLRAAALAAGVAAPVVLVVHAALSANLAHVRDWRFDAASRDAMAAIGEALRSRDRTAAPARVSTFWTLAPALGFYRDRLGVAADLLEEGRSPAPAGTDFSYLLYADALAHSRAEKVPIAVYDGAGTILLHRPPR